MAGVKGRSGGRNRKTPEQHVLEGTHRRDRHGSKPETDPSEVLDVPDAVSARSAKNSNGSDAIVSRAGEDGSIAAPAGLVKAERAFWETFAPLMASAKVLTPADVQTLADYCRACAAVDERGRRLRTAFRKRAVDTQLVRMLDVSLRGWVERKTRLAGELGLTAIARTRVAWSGHPQVATPKTPTSPSPKPTSKLAELQAQAAELRRPLEVRTEGRHPSTRRTPRATPRVNRETNKGG